MKNPFIYPVLIAAILIPLCSCGGKSSDSAIGSDNADNETVFESIDTEAIVSDGAQDTKSECSVIVVDADTVDEVYDEIPDYDVDEADSETNWEKTKGVYKAAKNKLKAKKDKWKEDHQDEIDKAKERTREAKQKAKEKVGGWLDRMREKLEDD